MQTKMNVHTKKRVVASIYHFHLHSKGPKAQGYFPKSLLLCDEKNINKNQEEINIAIRWEQFFLL